MKHWHVTCKSNGHFNLPTKIVCQLEMCHSSWNKKSGQIHLKCVRMNTCDRVTFLSINRTGKILFYHVSIIKHDVSLKHWPSLTFFIQNDIDMIGMWRYFLHTVNINLMSFSAADDMNTYLYWGNITLQHVQVKEPVSPLFLPALTPPLHWLMVAWTQDCL